MVRHGGFHPNFSEQKAYYDEGKVYAIQIEMNLACPQGCTYCYASSDNPPVREMPRRDVIAIIDAAVAMQVRAIDWLGGDPLVRKDWYALMQYAQNQGLCNNIWTSGIPLNDATVAQQAVEVSKGGFISVHLDTLNEDIYNTLHTGDGKRKIKAILTGVDNVQSFGKDPTHMINCITFTKPVATDVEHTIKYFFAQKGMRTCLTQMCLAGLAEDRPDLIPSRAEIQHACEVRDKLNYPNSSVSMASMDTNKYYCGGIICVTIDGDVTPCSVIRRGVGNIHTEPLASIVAYHQKELLFLPLHESQNLPEDCIDCSNNAACWGCRAAAFYQHGDVFAQDPNCYLCGDNKK